MLSSESLRFLFPEMFRVNYILYPVFILLAMLILCFGIGLVRGMKEYVYRSMDNKRDFWNAAATAVAIVQILSLWSALLLAFIHEYPNIKPGGIGSEIGIGFAIVVSILLFMVGPWAFKAIDKVFIKAGKIPGFLYGLISSQSLSAGCMVVQTVQKHSKRLEPRARQIRPEEHGDYIDYVVDKFRRVVAVHSGIVTIMTRSGDLLQIKASDPLLRKPTLLELLRWHSEFPPRKRSA